jgi:hypothetical protein
MRTIALDSQILNTLQACGRKVDLEFLRNWRPTEKAEALEKGDLMHRMLAHYYRERKKGRTKDPNQHSLVVGEAIELGRRAASTMDISVSTSEEDIRQFKENILFWQADGWEILEVEQPFSKVIYEREDKPGREGLRILYEGVIDLVVVNPSPYGVFIVDHKTSSRRGNVSKLSNQFMGYSWAMSVNSVIINKIGFQKTLAAKDRFNRLYLQYEREVLKEWVRNTIYWVHVLVGYVDQNYFPPNFTSCDKYSGCIFKDVCESIPQVREFKLQAHFYEGKPWSPHTRDDEDGEE